jgi:putative protease
MATKKTAKSKIKRKKTTAKRPAVRRKPLKVAKKVVKKVLKKITNKLVKKPARKAPTKPASPPPPPPPPGERIGVVTHYYGHLSVAVVKLESATLRVGDTIHIRGHTTDFSQRVESLQVGHAPVNEVGPNDDFGLKVIDHAREHDVVYKVK